MQLFALGINHKHADVASREPFSVNADAACVWLQELQEHPAVCESVVLSTCNRTEIYTSTRCHFSVAEWLRQKNRQAFDCSRDALYQHLNQDMVRHVMTVASGLDSVVIGEPQILGQMKSAYQQSLSFGAVGPVFQNLFPAVFKTAKQVRRETTLGQGALTLAYAAMQLIYRHRPSLSDATVLLIGAGETIELMASYLKKKSVRRLMIANRTLSHAHVLARQADAVPLGLDQLSDALMEADIVISATASDQPVIKKEYLQHCAAARPPSPLLLLDLAMPRDIDPAVSELPNVVLHNLDAVAAVMADSQKSRAQAACQAQSIVDMQAADYARQLRLKNAGAMIRRYHHRIDRLRQAELQRALKSLRNNQDPEHVVTQMARRLTRQFVHTPTRKIRHAALNEQDSMMQLLKELYELTE